MRNHRKRCENMETKTRRSVEIQGKVTQQPIRTLQPFNPMQTRENCSFHAMCLQKVANSNTKARIISLQIREKLLKCYCSEHAEREKQMQEPVNGITFLEELSKKAGREVDDFKTLSRFLNAKAAEKGVPIFGQFELTPLCNFDCKMCYVHLEADQLAGRKLLPVETWKGLMHQAWEMGMMHVNLTGGECLTYPGLEELFLYLHSLGCDVSILTNGYLLDDRWIEFFRQHNPAMIQITLYGWNDDVYERVSGRRAFGKVAENARRAIDAGLNVSLTMTPNRYLGEDALETVRFGRSLSRGFSINSDVFPPREETGRSQQRDDPDADHYVRIHRLLNELNGLETKEIEAEKLPPAGGPSHQCDGCGLQCGGGRSGFVINWKGTLMPCNRLDMIHADPLKEGFKAAWTRINREANSWPRVPECEGCAYSGVCNNCAANMLQFAEPGKQPTGLCELTKYYVRHGIKRIPECEA